MELPTWALIIMWGGFVASASLLSVEMVKRFGI